MSHSSGAASHEPGEPTLRKDRSSPAITPTGLAVLERTVDRLIAPHRNCVRATVCRPYTGSDLP